MNDKGFVYADGSRTDGAFLVRFYSDGRACLPPILNHIIVGITLSLPIQNILQSNIVKIIVDHLI